MLPGHAISVGICTFGPRSAGTRTARPSAITRSPRTSAIPRRATSRRRWCTASAAPIASTAPRWSGWCQHPPGPRCRWRSCPGRREGSPAGDRDRGQLRARRRPHGRATLGPARHRQRDRHPADGRGAARAARGGAPGDGGSTPRPAGLQARRHQRWLDRVWLPAAKDLSLSQLYRALTCSPSTGMRSKRRCSGPAPICSSSTSTWCSTT